MLRKRTDYSYRQKWIKANGPIPVDEHGRSYEIHHLDGNYANDDPSNLVAVSIEEHYRIHLEQGDWAACKLIAARMNLTHDSSGENNSFWGKKHPKESMLRMVESRRKSGGGDYHHGRIPIAGKAALKEFSERMRTNNPMKVPGAALAMQPKRIATLKSFDYWYEKHFKKASNYQEIEEFIANNPDFTHRDIQAFGVKLDFAKSMTKRFKQNAVAMCTEEVATCRRP